MFPAGSSNRRPISSFAKEWTRSRLAFFEKITSAERSNHVLES